MRRDDSDRLFDQRVVRRNISAGRISKDDHKRFIEALPDVSDKIKPPDEGGDDDGWDGTSPREASESHQRPMLGMPLPRPDFGARASSLDDDDDDDDDLDDDDDDDDLDDDDDSDGTDDAPEEPEEPEEPRPSGGDDGGL
jgi:hypothetical protein